MFFSAPQLKRDPLGSTEAVDAASDHSAGSSLRLKKAFVRATAVIGVLSLFYTAYLYYDYSARMPIEPQQQTGRTYPVSLKGETFYTTRTEQRRYYATQYIFLASVITIGAMSWIQWRRSLSRAA